jgi:hypothetical protein
VAPVLLAFFYPYSFSDMDDKKETIGLAELLQEITDRIAVLKDKRHPRAYDLALWWELEKDVIAARHSILNCTVRPQPLRRRWKKRYIVPGRWFDLFMVFLCAFLGVLALLK